jgi:MFS family permease
MRALYLCLALEAMSMGIVLPVLPFFAEGFGASPFQITALFSFYALMQFGASLAAGALSDRLGRRPVLLVSVAGTTASFVWLAIVGSLWELIAARAFGGAMGAAFAISNAYVADHVSERERAGAMGRLAACQGLGMCLGPAIGGVLTGGAFGFGLRSAIWFATIASAASVAVALLVPASGGRAAHRAAEPRGEAPRVLTSPAARYAILTLLAIEIVVSGLLALFPIWVASRFGWTAMETGMMLFFVGVLLFVVQGALVGPLVRRIGEVRTVAMGLVVLMLGFLTFDLVDQWPLLLVCGALICFGAGVGVPALFGFASTRSSARWQGTILGALQSAICMAAIVGPLLAGALFQYAGPAWPWRAFAFLTAGTFAATWVWQRNALRWEERDPVAAGLIRLPEERREAI